MFLFMLCPTVAWKVKGRPDPSNMQLNSIHKIQIDSLAFGGEGVGRIDGMVAFVPFAVEGETMEIEIVEVKKKYCRGKEIQLTL